MEREASVVVGMVCIDLGTLNICYPLSGEQVHPWIYLRWNDLIIGDRRHSGIGGQHCGASARQQID